MATTVRTVNARRGVHLSLVLRAILPLTVASQPEMQGRHSLAAVGVALDSWVLFESNKLAVDEYDLCTDNLVRAPYQDSEP